MNFRKLSPAVGAIIVSLFIVIAAQAQSNPRYIRFAGLPSAVKGALFTPDAPQKPPHVAILVMHRASNFLNTLACPELSKRGFMVLCMNPRSDNQVFPRPGGAHEPAHRQGARHAAPDDRRQTYLSRR